MKQELGTNLRDAHLHLPEHGRELSCLNLASCASKHEALELLSAQEVDASGWVLAVACRPQGWDVPEWPTAKELDEATGGKACVVRSFDFHCLAASSAALRLAGITSETADPLGGMIERDEAGEPTGVLMERAMRIVEGQIPEPSDGAYREQVREALADLARFGIVEAHDMLSTERLCRALMELDARGELEHTIWLHPTMEHLDDVLAYRNRLPEQVGIGGMKIFTDGTLNSRTASMLHPYEHPREGSPCGIQMMSREQIDRAIDLAASRALPIVAHAIGDRAVRTMLDAIHAWETTHDNVTDLPHRIEHAQFIDKDDAHRFAHLRVVASPQVCHLLPDMEALHRLVPGRMDRAFVLRELFDEYRKDCLDPALFLWLGSDTPVVSPDPADTLQAAVHRRRSELPESDAIAPEQALTEGEAIMCMQSWV